MPERLGPYDILGEVGHGATGTVYLGHDQSLDRPVALKVLSPAVVDQRDFRERFAAEARLMAEIDDPNCVRIYDFSDGDRPYIVSEYINGATLREVVQGAGRLTPEQSLAVLDGALAGLARLHEKGLVHRDIKPENIFCDAEGTSKLGDFGLAVSVGTVAPAMSTGSANYMSPELVSGQPVDARSDIYACGATLFELLTGAAPYAGGDSLAVMRKQQKGAVPDARKGNPGVPVTVANLVKAAMAKSPDQRPASVAEFRAQLEESASKAFGAGWRTAASVAGVAGVAIAAGTAATTALAAGGGTVLAAGAGATAVGSATVGGTASEATSAAATGTAGSAAGAATTATGTGSGTAGAAGGGAMSAAASAGSTAKKGLSTTQKVAAGAAAVVVAAVVVVAAASTLGRPASSPGAGGGNGSSGATSGKLTPEDITLTGQINKHLTEANAFCNSDPKQGLHVGLHFKDGVNIFLLGPSGPGPYHAMEPLPDGTREDSVSVRNGSSDLIAEFFKNASAVTFAVNADRLSGTVDADLVDSGNPQVASGHIKGSWRCVAGTLKDSYPS